MYLSHYKVVSIAKFGRPYVYPFTHDRLRHKLKPIDDDGKPFDLDPIEALIHTYKYIHPPRDP